MRKNPLIFLEHILTNIELIERSTKGLSKKDFESDQDIADATIRRIEIIGEAVKNLPSDFTRKYPNVEWKKIAGMRDKAIHHYFGIDLNTVWKVVEENLSELKKNLSEILQKEKKAVGK